MKIRIISDLHIDVNGKIPLTFDDDVFTVIAGDISGYAEDTIGWVSSNIQRGVFIEGNHIAYQGKYTVNMSHEALEQCFPLYGNVSYLHDSHKVVGDVVFVGGTLWTDFTLGAAAPGDRLVNMAFAKAFMNDYRQRLSDGKALEPDDTSHFFRETFRKIRRVCEFYRNRKVVVVTHHAPSPRSLDDRYVNHVLNPCYATNLERLILDHPNIALWCHGHIHQSKDYLVGSTRVVCNPRGYEAMGEVNPAWDRDFFVEV